MQLLLGGFCLRLEAVRHQLRHFDQRRRIRIDRARVVHRAHCSPNIPALNHFPSPVEIALGLTHPRDGLFANGDGPGIAGHSREHFVRVALRVAVLLRLQALLGEFEPRPDECGG